MEDFDYYNDSWYDNDDLREMGDREAWEDAQGECDLGDLHDLDDEDADW